VEAIEALSVLTTPDPDAALVARAQSGDRGALEAIYRKYIRRVYNLVYRVVGDAQHTEDLAQEVFYQVYRNLDRFQGRSRFYTWLFRVATNVAVAHGRKLASRGRETAFEDRHPSTNVYANPATVAESRDTFQRLDRALKAMPAAHRAMIVLGPIQHHSYEELSQILGISENAVKARMHRARASLSAAMSRMQEVAA